MVPQKTGLLRFERIICPNHQEAVSSGCRKGERPMEDEEIINLFLSREESAIARTQEKYGFRLRLLAREIVADDQAAEECENDTYLAAWNSIPPNTPRTFFYAYLARITRNRAINLCRDRNRLKRRAFLVELSGEMEQCIPAPDDLECRIQEAELKTAINGFLGTLPEERRNLFLRRYWFLDSVEAIAKRYGLSESKVKTTLFRIRNQMRKYLQKEGYSI